jgi:succinate dehydrogenase/fumarate reductase flavoprotein subunit
MAETMTFDIVIVGSGLAGLRAAIEAAQVSKGKASIAVITKVQAMRSHSVSAEGGTAAVLSLTHVKCATCGSTVQLFINSISSAGEA